MNKKPTLCQHAIYTSLRVITGIVNLVTRQEYRFDEDYWVNVHYKLVMKEIRGRLDKRDDLRLDGDKLTRKAKDLLNE